MLSDCGLSLVSWHISNFVHKCYSGETIKSKQVIQELYHANGLCGMHIPIKDKPCMQSIFTSASWGSGVYCFDYFIFPTPRNLVFKTCLQWLKFFSQSYSYYPKVIAYKAAFKAFLLTTSLHVHCHSASRAWNETFVTPSFNVLSVWMNSNDNPRNVKGQSHLIWCYAVHFKPRLVDAIIFSSSQWLST